MKNKAKTPQKPSSQRRGKRVKFSANSLKKNPRLLAVDVLVRVFEQNSYSNLLLNQRLSASQLSASDKRLATTIVYGVIQHQYTLEWWLSLLTTPKTKLAPWVKTLLLCGLYQLAYLDKVPNHAVLNESIEIAKQNGHSGIRKLVTGILHAYLRQPQSKRDFSNIKDKVKRLSIQYSVPIWLIKSLHQQVGAKKTEKILASINHAPTQSVRVNLAMTTPNEAIAALNSANLTAAPSQIAQAGLVTTGFVPKTQAYQTGLVTLQDESAMLAVEALAVKPNDVVLDACAAPGGKTTQIAADLMKAGKAGSGVVYALDLHAHKVKLIQQNAQRLHTESRVKTQCLDARKVAAAFGRQKFDKVLVDAPCSGLGLMRRKPEVKYQKNHQASLDLAQIQLAILNEAAKTLKAGGRMVYSTCTILDTENQAVVDEFLRQNKNFKQIKTKTAKQIKANRQALGLTIYPDDFDSDGFFVATLIKKKGCD